MSPSSSKADIFNANLRYAHIAAPAIILLYMFDERQGDHALQPQQAPHNAY